MKALFACVTIFVLYAVVLAAVWVPIAMESVLGG